MTRERHDGRSYIFRPSTQVRFGPNFHFYHSEMRLWRPARPMRQILLTVYVLPLILCKKKQNPAIFQKVSLSCTLSKIRHVPLSKPCGIPTSPVRLLLRHNSSFCPVHVVFEDLLSHFEKRWLARSSFCCERPDQQRATPQSFTLN
jgi:hypothetical protein